MKLAFAWLLLAACARPAELRGERFTAVFPDGWVVAEPELAAEIAEDHQLPWSVRPRHVTVLVRSGTHAQSPAIVVTEYVDEPKPAAKLPAPQANLMGTVAVGAVLHEISEDTCHALNGLAVGSATTSRFDRGGLVGCELGSRAALAAGPGLTMVVVVRCFGAEPDAELDRACTTVSSSLRGT